MNRVHIIKTNSYKVDEETNNAIAWLEEETRTKVDTQHISLWPVHGDIYVVIPYEVEDDI